MLDSFDQVVFYTRPGQELLHLGLARELGRFVDPGCIVFVTFFTRSVDILRQHEVRIVYAPEELARLRDKAIDEELLARVDREIRDHDPDLDLPTLLSAERFLPRGESKQRRFCFEHVALLDELVRPGTLSVSSMFDHFFYWLAGTLANSRSGAHFAFNSCGIPPGVFALKDPWTQWEGQGVDNPAELWEQVQKDLTQPPEVRIDYMNPSKLGRPRVRENLRQFLFTDLRYQSTDSRRGSYFALYRSLPDFLYKISKAKLRQRLYNERWFQIRTEEEFSARKDEDYVFVPMHMEPEATILMYSTWFRDQIELCRKIRANLPDPVKIFVKENPKMVGRRQSSYYRELCRIPGLVLVAPSVPARPLIEASRAVVSLAGNASLEAIFLGKPAIVIGRPPFRHILSGCDYANGNGFREEAFRAWLQDPQLPDQETILREWSKWVSGTFAADGLPVWIGHERQINDRKENVEKYVHFMMEALQAKCIKE